MLRRIPREQHFSKERNIHPINLLIILFFKS